MCRPEKASDLKTFVTILQNVHSFTETEIQIEKLIKIDANTYLLFEPS
jgi:hypothetical protein